MIHISEFNSATPQDVKFIKIDKEYTIYLHPNYPNQTKDVLKGMNIKYENKNRSHIRSD